MNYRCMQMPHSLILDFHQSQDYCASLNGSVMTFYDDVDLNSCLADPMMPEEGCYVSFLLASRCKSFKNYLKI